MLIRSFHKKLSVVVLITLFSLIISNTVYAKKCKVSLNTTSVTISKGDTYQLRIKNGKKAKWSTTKSSVASVTKNGMIIAKGEGKCSIKAVVGKTKLSCKVVVKKKGELAPSETIDEITYLINQARLAQGKGSLQIDPTLCEIAQERAYEITKEFSHTRPNGENCFDIMDEYDYQFTAVGENIAAGQKDESEVMTDWLNSPGHRRNIMNGKFNKVGIGLVKEENSTYGYYWVQVFSN